MTFSSPGGHEKPLERVRLNHPIFRWLWITWDTEYFYESKYVPLIKIYIDLLFVLWEIKGNEDLLIFFDWRNHVPIGFPWHESWTKKLAKVDSQYYFISTATVDPLSMIHAKWTCVSHWFGKNGESSCSSEHIMIIFCSSITNKQSHVIIVMHSIEQMKDLSKFFLPPWLKGSSAGLQTGSCTCLLTIACLKHVWPYTKSSAFHPKRCVHCPIAMSQDTTSSKLLPSSRNLANFKAKQYCWWFRNPKQPPFGCINPL